MKIISQDNRIENIYEAKKMEDSIDHFCQQHQLGKNLKVANAYKTKGIAVLVLFTYLLKLVFSKKSMYMNMATGTHIEYFEKDTIYRILNTPRTNWNRLVLTTVGKIIEDINPLTSESRISVIVFDDSFYGRRRSEKVELLANVFDHASKGKNYKRVFRQLYRVSISSTRMTSTKILKSKKSKCVLANLFEFKYNSNMDGWSNINTIVLSTFEF